MFKAEVSKGRNPVKKQPNLFPVSSLERRGVVHSSSEELASVVHAEFQDRWRALPDDVLHPLVSSPGSADELDLSIGEVMEAAKT